MRVAILGVGGLGRTLASELRGDPRVTSLLLVDLYGERARVLTGIRGRVAIDRLATIDAIRIRSGGVATLPGHSSSPLYSREVFLSDVLSPPTVWLDGALQDRAPLSEPEEYGFPPPVGSQRTYLISHEEVKTLPKFLGKPIGRVDYKYVLDPHLVQAILSLDKLDLLADSHMIRMGNQMVSFRRAFLAAFPEPSALVLPLEGAESLSVEVEGQTGGKRVVYRGDITLTHQEANRRRSTTAASYLGAVGAAIGTALIGDKATPGPGVYPAEALDPTRVFREWAARGLPMAWSERVLSN